MTYEETDTMLRLMRLNWPKAPMFTQTEYGTLVELWALCLMHISHAVAQVALVDICRTCKYPPTIAEFCAAANVVAEKLSAEAEDAYDTLRWVIPRTQRDGATHSKIYASLSRKTRLALDAMGGLEAFAPADSLGYNYSGFIRAYQREALQALSPLPPLAVEAEGR